MHSGGSPHSFGPGQPRSHLQAGVLARDRMSGMKAGASLGGRRSLQMGTFQSDCLRMDRPIDGYSGARESAASAGSHMRDLRGMNCGLRASMDNAKVPFAGTSRDGSDGTRTRDLRRDRPLQWSRRLTTIDAQSLDLCALSGFSRSDVAWLSGADSRRLLPVCCPTGPVLEALDGKYDHRVVAAAAAIPYARRERPLRFRAGVL
jgi:hypothetical protein